MVLPHQNISRTCPWRSIMLAVMKGVFEHLVLVCKSDGALWGPKARCTDPIKFVDPLLIRMHKKTWRHGISVRGKAEKKLWNGGV